MALIECIECKHKISDKATVCTNCGCPVEVTINAMKTLKAVEESKIIDKYDILGKDFVVDEESDKYIRFIVLINTTKEKYISHSRSVYYQLGNINSVIDDFPKIIAQILEEAINSAVQIMTSFGIYDYDQYSFYQKYSEYFDTESIMEPIINKYLSILNYEEGIKNYHDYIRQSRSNRWSGGGFGIKGALKGYFEAQLLNAGSAVLHSIPDSVNRNKDMDEIVKAKRALYKDKNTLNAMISALEKIFDSTYNAMLTELINAGKIKSVIKDKNKADSIINNVISSYNAGNLPYDQQCNFCCAAFFENPTSYRTIETILLLGIDDSGDVTRYAQKYGFYEVYQKHLQDELKSKYRKELEKLWDLSDQTIAVNSDLDNVIKQCMLLVDKGFDIKENVDNCIEKAIKSRLTFPVSDNDKKNIIQQLKDFDNLYGTSYLDKYNPIIEACEIDNSDQSMVSEILETLCYKECYKGISDTKYGNSTNIKYISYYSEYETFANIPFSANIFLLHSFYNTSEKKPSKVLAITDKGVFTYKASELKSCAISWKDLIATNLDFDYTGITFDGNSTYIFEKEIYDLLCEIRENLISYYKNHRNGIYHDDETDYVLAKKEIELIKKTYESNSDKIDAFKTILQQPIKTKSGISLLHEKEKMLWEIYLDKRNVQKKYTLAKLIIKSIIYIILTLVWIYFIGNLHWIINILCGFVVFCFIVSIFNTIMKIIIDASSAKEFTKKFESYFILLNGHLKIKES